MTGADNKNPATTSATSIESAGPAVTTTTGLADQPTEQPSPATTATPTGSGAGCGEAADGLVSVAAGRRAFLRNPGMSSPGHRVPAVVVLHGYTGTPERIEQTSGWTPFARDHGAIVAYAEGTPVRPEGFAWTTGTARYSATGTDDVAYLAALVNVLVTDHCVDRRRIVLTGESNGGAMTIVAACDTRTANLFRLFAPVIPAIDDRVLTGCGTGPPLSFAAVASRKDQTIPYDGIYPKGQTPLLAQEQWFLQLAAQRNGCRRDNPSRVPLAGAELITAAGCQMPLMVAVDDGHHTWPGGPVGTGGLEPGHFPTTAYLWSLFQLSGG